METFQHSSQFFRSSLELAYVDGLSITHGNEPRHHIWSYAVGSYDGSIYYGCPCDKEDPPPSTVNNNYYCESGATDYPSSESTYFFSDPLWDGSGCSTNNTCCSNERLPWFYHNLGNSTTDGWQSMTFMAKVNIILTAILESIDQCECSIREY